MKQRFKMIAVLFAIFSSSQISNQSKAQLVPAYGCTYTGIGFEICRSGSVYVYNCKPGNTTCGYKSFEETD